MEHLALDLLHQSDLTGIGGRGESKVAFVVDCTGGFEEFDWGEFVECGEFGDVEDGFGEHFLL